MVNIHNIGTHMRVIDILKESDITPKPKAAIPITTYKKQYKNLIADIEQFLRDDYKGPFYVNTRVHDNHTDNLRSPEGRTWPVILELIKFYNNLKKIYGNGTDVNYSSLYSSMVELKQYVLSQRKPSTGVLTPNTKPVVQGKRIPFYTTFVNDITNFLNSKENVQLYSKYGYFRDQVTPEQYEYLKSFIEYTPVSEEDAKSKIDIFTNFLNDRDSDYKTSDRRKESKKRMAENPLPPDLDTNNPLHAQWLTLARDVVLRRESTITFLEMWDIIKLQEWRCALSNREFNETNNRLSFDRINSDRSYEVGNLWFTTHAINVMKNQLTTDQFVSLCKFIHDRNTVNTKNGSI
jgi:hypothetical protein